MKISAKEGVKQEGTWSAERGKVTTVAAVNWDGCTERVILSKDLKEMRKHMLERNAS